MLIIERGSFIMAFSQKADGDFSFYLLKREETLKIWQSLPIVKKYNLNAPKWAVQIHENRILSVENSDLQTASEKADGLITSLKNCPVGVFSADCLPILLYSGNTCAAVHAGWKGTLKNIAASAIKAFASKYKTEPKDIYAVLGPCIDKCCLEMGLEVYESFINASSEYKRFFTHDDRPRLNLRGLNRLQLINSGLKSKNITSINDCTYCQNEKYFSFRRQKNRCGSMFSFIAAL